MAFCTACGKEILEGATFCVHCGQAVESEAPVAPEAPVVPAYTEEEQAFLTWSYRFMTWERKARRIEGTVYLIVGIVYAAIFFLAGILGGGAMSMANEMAGTFFLFIYLTVAFVCGGMLIAVGIIQKTAVKKLDPYIMGFDTDCRPALTRCGSVGMLVFSLLFGAVSAVFFLINFIRIKANGRLIAQIQSRQP